MAAGWYDAATEPQERLLKALGKKLTHTEQLMLRTWLHQERAAGGADEWDRQKPRVRLAAELAEILEELLSADESMPSYADTVARAEAVLQKAKEVEGGEAQGS